MYEQEVQNTKLFDSFHLFPRLPIDIRVKIWHAAFPGPRVLTVVVAPRCSCPNSFSLECKSPHYIHTPNTLPTLLFVNQESRYEIQRKYVMIRGKSGFRLAFNHRIDSVYFVGGTVREWPLELVNEDLQRDPKYEIRKLVVGEVRLWCERRDDAFSPDDYMKKEEIIILLAPWHSLKEPPLERKDCLRTLRQHQDMAEEKGWGDVALQRDFLEWVERMKTEEKYPTSPTLKVAQWSYSTDNGPFVLTRQRFKHIDAGLFDLWEEIA